MRIQHNIAAMNAYRNYNTNTSAVSKNLEKLSSGYKINRAGDDAAGLAISEKMRAQISGLEAASKNVKDGISLVKTAEGAMQEVQDMLNRMVTLATQSANGTYDNEVDRLNLQKEVDQLKSEINRIADSSNFNGIKLMDGSQEIKTSYQLSSPSSTAAAATTDGIFSIVSDGQMGVDAQAGVFTYDLSQLKISVPENASVPHQLMGNNVEQTLTVATEGTDSATAVYELDLTSLLSSIKMEDDGTGTMVAVADGVIQVAVGDNTFDVSVSEGDDFDTIGAAIETALDGNIQDGLGGDYTVKYDSATDPEAPKLTFTANKDGVDGSLVKEDGGPATVTFTETAIATPATSYAATWTDGGSSAEATYKFDLAGLTVSQDDTELTFTIAGKDYKVTANTDDDADAIAEKLVEALNADPITDGNAGDFTAANASGAITLTAASTGAADDATPFISTYSVSTGGAGSTVKYDVTFANQTITLDLEAGKEYVGSDIAKMVEEKLKADGSNYSLAGSSFSTTAYGSTLTITMDEAPKKAWTEDMTLKFTQHNDKTFIGNGGEQFDPTVETQPIDSTTQRQYAQATIDLTAMDIRDGTTIQLGNTSYTFAIGSDSRFKNSENIVDLTDLTAEDFKEGGRGFATAANRLSKSAAANTTFYVGSDTQGKVSLTEKEGAIDYAVNNLAGADGKGTGGTGTSIDGSDPTTAAGGEVSDKFDSTLSDWKGLVKFGTASVSGSGLTLQIGDTSDEYNQLVVSIGDIHTKALGIDGIDISTQSGAQTAIDTIKNAINSVSSIRGTLGATQNRLEHTANNLSVMTENIQDAESTIRDTDIAEEMMAYTKNNILVQSAQAMLAQANQIPQGVLQLLG